MAVAAVVLQLENHGGVDAVAAVALHAHLQGQGIGLGKAAADVGGGEDIGIIAQHVQRVVPVEFIHAHGQDRAQTEGADKLHQTAHTGLLTKALGHLPRLGQADVLDGSQLIRVVLQDFQGLVPKTSHQDRGRGRADALHRAAGQVLVDGPLPCRHETLGEGGLELPPVDVVVHPGAADDHALAAGGIGEAAHDRDVLPVLIRQAQNGVTVVLVFIDDRIDGAGYLQKLDVLIHAVLYSVTCLKGASRRPRYSSPGMRHNPRVSRQRPGCRRRRRPRGQGR